VVSEVLRKEQIKEILPECLDAIRFNRQFYLAPIIAYSDLGIFSSFIKENQLEKLQQSIPPKLYQLSEENEELFKTLYTFFITNRNYKNTAETLFLHAKTIRYRLSKIEQLLEIDLTSPIQLVNYEIGTYLLELQKRSQEKRMAIDHRCFGVPLSCFGEIPDLLSRRRFCLWNPSRHSRITDRTISRAAIQCPHSRLFTGAQFLVSGDFGAELAKFSRIASNCA